MLSEKDCFLPYCTNTSCKLSGLHINTSPLINSTGFFSSTTQKEDIAIDNLKPRKSINHPKPKLTSTARQVSKSLHSTSSNVAHKTFNALAKHQSDINEKNHRYVRIHDTQQSINFILAKCRFRVRRATRGNQEHARLVTTGKEDGYIRIAWGWIVDYTVYVLYLIWGILQPIVLILVMMVVRIVIMIVCTLFYLCLFYLLLITLA